MSETQVERLTRQLADANERIISLVDTIIKAKEALNTLLEVHGHPDDMVIQEITKIANQT